MPTAANPSARPATYLGLIESFPLRPIRSEAGLAAAIAMMRTLTARDLDEDEADYLDVLGTLIKHYEDEHHPVPRPTPGQVLRAMLTSRDASQADLARATTIPESTVSAILAGRRGVSKANARAFAKFFGVSVARFIDA